MRKLNCLISLKNLLMIWIIWNHLAIRMDIQVFYVKDAVLVQKPILLKDAHVKCSMFADGVIKPVIFFNRPELFDQLMNVGQDSFDLAVQVSENHWNGKISIELQGIDIAFKS